MNKRQSTLKQYGRYALTTIAASTLLFAGSCKSKNSGGSKATVAPQYTMYQQIFCLNMLSNISGMYNYKINIQDSTIKAVNYVLNDPASAALIGHWQPVWGPVVFSNDEDPKKKQDSAVAVNTMFIAQNTDSPSLYVIAIAGTNPKSYTAWIAEDADWTKTITWANVLKDDTVYTGGMSLNNQDTFISKGTFFGLHKLLNMKDASTGKRAMEYLKETAAKNPMTIWVTGHSLGGALAPTMALYLNDTKDKWAAKNGSNTSINCLAVAGATPGGAIFAYYYNQRMGANTIRVWNAHDVVPHGYEMDMLQEVKTIYSDDKISKRKNLETPLKVKTAIDVLSAALRNPLKPSNPYNYTQLCPVRDTVFTSDFYTDTNIINASLGTANPDSFTAQLGCQHIPSYPHYFGVDEFQHTVSAKMGYQLPFFSFGYKPSPILSVKSFSVIK